MQTSLIVRNTALPTATPEELEQALAIGDLGKLAPALRVRYYAEACKSTGLNPLTRPFDLLKNQAGQMVLYLNATGAEQLRKRDRVSIRIVSRARDESLYIVTVAASTPDGRVEESQGIADLAELKSKALANAMMKCETAAKRRVTLSICGMGFAPEDDYTQAVAFNPRTGEIPGEIPADDLPEALAQAYQKIQALDDRAAEVSGDHRPHQTGLGVDICHMMETMGVTPQEIGAWWTAQQAKYSDMTPAVLSMLHERVKVKFEASTTPTAPTDAETIDETLFAEAATEAEPAPDAEGNIPF